MPATHQGRWPEVGASADPARVDRGIERLLAAVPEAAARADADVELRSALVTVMAAGPFLTRTCTTVPGALDVLADLDRPVGPAASLAEWKSLEVLRIAALDLTGRFGLEQVGQALSDLADGILGSALAGGPERSPTTDRPTGPGAGLPGTDRPTAGADLAVIGMGKLGARELNYGSDIDIVLVGRAGAPEAQRFVATVRSAWRTDLDLRPEGRAGQLVRSLESYEAYWDRWAQTWEFQALLKARPVAGQAEMGAGFALAASRRVWQRPLSADDLRSLRDMKARSEQIVQRQGLSEREIKLGRGGIRDIEFAAQLLQLVHGRDDAAVRAPATLDALAALSAGGYVGQRDAVALASAYRFLRAVEHRLQLFDDRQVHALPAAAEARAHLARVMGYRDGPAATALARFETDLTRHQAEARSAHERIYFRPLLEAFTSASGRAPGAPPGTSIAPAAVEERLAAFGFSDATRTREAVVELTRGFTRSSRLMQHMVPLLLDWVSASPDPDLGLLGLRRLATGEHRRGQLVSLFRDSPDAARHMCLLLGTGPGFAEGYERHPDQLALLAGGPPPLPTPATLERRAIEGIAWRRRDQWWRGLSSLTRSELLRAQSRDVLGLDDLAATARGVTNLAEAVLGVCMRAIASGRGGLSGDDLPPAEGIAVVAMGRFGGADLAYASDLDVMVVFDDGRVPGEQVERMTEQLVTLVKGDTPVHRLYELDLSLRPEGRKGPLARSLRAFETYYARWAQVWERQALTRGRFVAGDPEVGRRFGELARDFVWGKPLSQDDTLEIRRLKARMERERVPAGEDPQFHLKLGPGSLSDVEWTVQLLQLRHCVPAEGTLDALQELTASGAIGSSDAEVLAEAYTFCELTRNRMYLVRGRPGDSLPRPGPQLGALARSLGTTAPELRERYRMLTRRARRVTERLFYGAGGP